MQAVDEARFREAQRGAQPGAASADDEHVVRVVDELVFSSHCAIPKATFSTAKMAATATSVCANVERMRERFWRHRARSLR